MPTHSARFDPLETFLTMILPLDFDLDRPDAELVHRLIEDGDHDRKEAEITVRLLRSDLPEPHE